MSSFSWQGAGGRWYEFDVARAKRAWDAAGGIYMFVKPGEGHNVEGVGPVILFLAKTNDFSQALAMHSMWASAQQLGAAEIHLIHIPDEQMRAHVEKDLLEAQAPILNRQMPRRAA